MGKLRLEPKAKTMDPKKYKEILRNLTDAREASQDSKIFWDLDKSEQSSEVRKEFLYVAGKEGLTVSIRQLRKSHSLALDFSGGKDERSRMSKDDYRKKVVKALTQADRPLKKSEVVDNAGISASTWNLRIQELLSACLVEKKGTRSETVYFLTQRGKK